MSRWNKVSTLFSNLLANNLEISFSTKIHTLWFIVHVVLCRWKSLSTESLEDWSFLQRVREEISLNIFPYAFQICWPYYIITFSKPQLKNPTPKYTPKYTLSYKTIKIVTVTSPGGSTFSCHLPPTNSPPQELNSW